MRYHKLIEMPIEQVQAFLEANLGHVAAGNALNELQRRQKVGQRLKRMGREKAVISGMTKTRHSASGPRVPTKRELR